MKQIISLLSLMSFVGLVGCGAVDDGLPRTVPASGTVICDGKPLDGVTVVIMQDDGKHFAQGMTDGSGRFELNAYETKKGAVPGTYRATVSKTVTVDMATPTKASKALAEDAQHAAEGEPENANVSWVNDLPGKYNSPVTSGLEVVVPEDGTKDITLEISRD